MARPLWRAPSVQRPTLPTKPWDLTPKDVGFLWALGVDPEVPITE